VEVESGKRSDRPQLVAALAAAKAAKATLVIAKLDRLARNVHFISGLLEGHVAFVCCDMPEADRAFLQMAAVFAEWEARKICCHRQRAALAPRGPATDHSGSAEEPRYRAHPRDPAPTIRSARL
jgi:DNA invertase Pin-like site-specific DNA recombinase